jgi:hypothetical protein
VFSHTLNLKNKISNVSIVFEFKCDDHFKFFDDLSILIFFHIAKS